MSHEPAHVIDFPGGCLCGAVRYVWSGMPLQVTHCHCQMCQRQHGAGCATYARVLKESLHIHAESGQVISYASSDKVLRQFCRTCGSSLFFDYAPMPHLMFVTVGTLDDSRHITPSRHIFMDSKAPWLEVHDDLPKFDEYP